MGLFGFRIRPVSGPEIVDFGGLNGLNPVQNPRKEVGREVPHHFSWVLGLVRAVWTHKIDDFRSGDRPDLKTRLTHFLAGLPALAASFIKAVGGRTFGGTGPAAGTGKRRASGRGR